ncbi:MAG: TonB-dependent receptor [Gemmatimonadaceae bacterium]|jgi:outer membrane receptor protein involved in Fe transport
MRFLRSLLVATLALAAVASFAQSQTPRAGRVVGRIIDAGTGQGLTDVAVQLVGTKMGTMSGVDGRFSINGVSAGTVTLFARRIGYQPKTITGLFMDAGKTLEQNISLSTATMQLSAVTVSAAAERGSVSEALDQQRISIGVVSSVTAEQIQKSPDGNAAQTVQRISGVSVQDGKYVFVRGLGERYTTSSLNGARVPSPEPEKRVVPLDLFPSGLLQTITTTKTFTPDLPGDFSGASVDIKTREFPAERTYSASLGSGYAQAATGKEILVGQTTGGERWGMVNKERDLPQLLREVGNLQGLNLNQGDKDLLVSQFRNAWTPTSVTAAPNMSAALSVGGNDPVLFGHRLGYLFSGTFARTTDVKADQVRALADRGPVRGSTVEIDRFEGSSSSQGVLWGGLANLSTMIGGSSRVMFNGMYNRTADNSARVESGSFENEGIEARIQRMQYVERTMYSTQLGGEFQIGERQTLDVSGTMSGVTRDEPDRTEFAQAIERTTPGGAPRYLWLNSGNGGSVRTFSSLDETNREARANYLLKFGAHAARRHSVKAGVLVRSTTRDAGTNAYSIGASLAPDNVRELPPEQIFDGRLANTNLLNIAPLSQGGSYDAADDLFAGYLMTDWALTERLRMIAGARYERDALDVHAQSTLGSPITVTKRWNDLLPSLAFNVTLPNDQQVRLSASRTLARPEYRELTPIKSRDVLNGDDTQGNDQLERTQIINVDARWEWYPSADEVLSAAVFAKQFDLPIERVYRASGSGSRTVIYVNAESATNYGLELEARKSLGSFAGFLRGFAIFANLTLMQSEISLAKDTQASATNLKRAMVGQAPYVLNTGLTWASTQGASSATLLFNRVGDRIDAAGDSPLPDVIERARNVLDLSVRMPLFSSVSMRFDAKNLLDADYRTTQGTVTREAYRVGRTVQVGFSWRP